MNRPENHDPLRELLSDAVSDVEPNDALENIRDRTQVTSMSSRRPWIYGAGAAVVATAATITAIAMAGNIGMDDSSEPGPATSSSSPSGESTQDGTSLVLPVYFVGDGPRGLRLFREFHPVQATGGEEITLSVDAAVAGWPYDPDYRNPWPEGTTVEDASYDGDVITVDLTTDGIPLRQQPAGMSAKAARMAVEQLVFTAQAAASDGRRPVQILVDGSHSDTVLGVPTAEPLSNSPVLETLSLMNITAPREGVTVAAGPMTATGVNNGPEAWVGWQLLDAEGTVVKDGFGTAEGWTGNRLFPWRVEVDLTDVTPGTYTFRAYNDDPSGGAEGSGPDEDTRTIIVK